MTKTCLMIQNLKQFKLFLQKLTTRHPPDLNWTFLKKNKIKIAKVGQVFLPKRSNTFENVYFLFKIKIIILLN